MELRSIYRRFYLPALLSLVYLYPVFVSAQSTIFQKTYSGAQSETPVDMLQKRDGGFLLLGHTYISHQDSGYLQSEIRITSTNEDGSLRWSRGYGTDNDDKASAAIETINNSFLIAGQTKHPEYGWMNASLFGIDDNGSKIWAKSFAEVDGNFCDIATTQDSNFVALGYGMRNIFVVKINELGEQLWIQHYPLDIDQDRAVIKSVGEDDIMIAGTANRDFFLCRLDGKGKVKWTRTYEGKANEHIGDIVESHDGGVILSGTSYSFGTYNASSPNIFAMKVDEKGELIWSQAIGNEKHNWNHSLNIDHEGRILLGGYQGRIGENQDMIISRLGYDGTYLESWSVGGIGMDNGGYAIQCSQDSGIVVLGRSHSFGKAAGRGSYYLVKTDREGNSGGFTKRMSMRGDQASVYVRDHKIRPISSFAMRKAPFANSDMKVRDMSLNEYLVCGNVKESFDPRAYVLAQARLRDSLALVALHDSTSGPRWRKSWDFSQPLANWNNVELDKDGRVVRLILTANHLAGNLPSQLGNLTRLEVLWLGTNRLTGTIPPEIGKLTSLRQLFLENNQLTGLIPIELASLVNLKQLRLANNNFNGQIPGELASLTNLQYISLRNNKLTGMIPYVLDSLAIYGVEIDLSNNILEGHIPPLMLTRKNTHLGGNKFEPHFQAKIAEMMGGKYESLADTGASYLLVINEGTNRFQLMKSIYDNDGGKYYIIKGEYELVESHLALNGEIMETGILGENIDQDETTTEVHFENISVTFDNTTENLQIQLHAFNQDINLYKTTR